MRFFANGIGVSVLAIFAAVHANSATLYDNSPVNGTLDAFDIASYSLTDSFDLSQSSTVTNAIVWLWVNTGDRPRGFDWAITTEPLGGTTVISGPAHDLVNTYVLTNQYSFDVYRASFEIPDTFLSAGTYWFQLSSGRTRSQGIIGWDESNGPSAASGSQFGPMAGIDVTDTTGSEAFQILGEISDGPEGGTPEPGSVILLILLYTPLTSVCPTAISF